MSRYTELADRANALLEQAKASTDYPRISAQCNLAETFLRGGLPLRDPFTAKAILLALNEADAKDDPDTLATRLILAAIAVSLTPPEEDDRDDIAVDDCGWPSPPLN